MFCICFDNKLRYIETSVLSVDITLFKVDPHGFQDPAFNLNEDPNPGSRTNADPCGSESWSDFKS